MGVEVSWTVVDPGKVTTKMTRVLRVDVPQFTDEIPYEDILGRHMTDPASLDWMASGGCVILANPEAYDDIQMYTELLVLGPQALLDELREMCLARKAVCLRWAA